MADIVASVPLLVMRTLRTAGKQASSSSAISTSRGVGVPKLTPFSSAAASAARISGSLWPWMAGPQVRTKSMSSRPSAVVSRALSALVVKKGVPPTERKARTGEFTPPGIICWARAKSSSETEGIGASKARRAAHGKGDSGPETSKDRPQRTGRNRDGSTERPQPRFTAARRPER